MLLLFLETHQNEIHDPPSKTVDKIYNNLIVEEAGI